MSAAGCIGMLALLALGIQPTQAQPVLPPETIAQVQETLGNRIEAVMILGGDYGASSGFYKFHGGNKTSLRITKIGGGGIVAEPMALGSGDLKWAPVLIGNVGFASSDNQFASGNLQGNQSLNRVFALEGGAGVRFFLTKHFSITPSLSGIYGQVENEFKALNPTGEYIKAVAGGTYVDWTVKTWTAVPELDLQYEYRWGRTVFALESRYTYFHTQSFSSTTSAVNVEGNSQTWENKIDVDAPLGWRMFGHELHTGGYFARSEIFGNAATALRENHLYTANGRLVLDVLGRAWKVKWIGLGASYFWGDNFSGWSGGLDLRLEF